MKRYLALGTVCCASIAAGLLLSYAGLSFAGELAALPSVGALVATLYQIARDQAAHERATEIQAKSQAFELAAMSHMSKVCFDKYVEFAEAYYSETCNVLAELFREGPTAQTGRNQNNLYELRRQYRLWITNEVMEDLDKFQDGLQQIGVKMRLQGAETDLARKNKLWEEAHDAFSQTLGIAGAVAAGRQPGGDYVVRTLQAILGADELASMRQKLMNSGSDVIPAAP